MLLHTSTVLRYEHDPHKLLFSEFLIIKTLQYSHWSYLLSEENRHSAAV